MDKEQTKKEERKIKSFSLKKKNAEKIEELAFKKKEKQSQIVDKMVEGYNGD